MLPGRSWRAISTAPTCKKPYAAAVDAQGARVAILPMSEPSRFRAFEQEVHNETNTTIFRNERSERVLSSGKRPSSSTRNVFYTECPCPGVNCPNPSTGKCAVIWDTLRVASNTFNGPISGKALYLINRADANGVDH